MTSVPDQHVSHALEADRGRAGRYRPGAAGAGYLVAWAAALAAWPVNLALNAASAQVAAAYRLHPAEAIVQYVLAEGLAAVLLGVVIGCAVAARPGWRSPSALAGLIAGAVAIVISLTQCVLGVVLTAAAAADQAAARTGSLSDLVNRLDGAKMLALAVAAVALSVVRPAAAPRWLRIVAIALMVALAASGYAYLTLTSSLAWTAYVSGPLLILWVTGTGIWLSLGRRGLLSK